MGELSWPETTTPDWRVLPNAAGPPLIAWTSVSDAMLRRAIVSILRNTGYVVAGTEDPQRLIDGVGRARANGAHQPTLVVIGPATPEEDTIALAARLHEIDRALPIIAVVDDGADEQPREDELLIVRPWELGLIHVAAQAVAASRS